MNGQRGVAKKYATAFLNVFGDQILLQDYHALLFTVDFLKKHYTALTLLSVPTISRAQKIYCIEKLFAHTQAPSLLLRVAKLLVEHQRIELLPLVCECIVQLYEKRNHIMPVTLTSFPALEAEQVKKIVNFLAEKTGQYITYTAHVDKKLIAGVRMQSGSFLWEYSIAQQLRVLKRLSQ